MVNLLRILLLYQKSNSEAISEATAKTTQGVRAVFLFWNLQFFSQIYVYMHFSIRTCMFLYRNTYFRTRRYMFMLELRIRYQKKITYLYWSIYYCTALVGHRSFRSKLSDLTCPITHIQGLIAPEDNPFFRCQSNKKLSL